MYIDSPLIDDDDPLVSSELLPLNPSNSEKKLTRSSMTSSLSLYIPYTYRRIDISLGTQSRGDNSPPCHPHPGQPPSSRNACEHRPRDEHFRPARSCKINLLRRRARPGPVLYQKVLTQHTTLPWSSSLNTLLPSSTRPNDYGESSLRYKMRT
jgi:hypothetical protein